MGEVHNIYWTATPLAFKKRAGLQEQLSKLPLQLAQTLGEQIAPENEHHVFWKIKHWSLSVDGVCFELSPDAKKNLNIKKVLSNTFFPGIPTTALAAPHHVEAEEWQVIRDQYSIVPEWRKVGQTTWSAEEIREEGLRIWNDHNKGWYGFFTQNCQNYALMLYKSIATQSPDVTAGPFERIPVPASYRLGQVSRAGVVPSVGWTAFSGRTAYVAYVVETPSEAAGALGATNAASTTAVATGSTGLVPTGAGATGVVTSGTTSAGGAGGAAAGGGVAGSGGVAGGGSVAGGGAASGAVSTTTTNIVAVEGTGTTGAVGTSGATIQTTAGSVKTASIGGTKTGAFGTKFAALSNTAHAKAGIFAAKAAKVGALGLKVAPLCMHPLGAAAVTLVLLYLALRGGRDKLPNEKELLKSMRGEKSRSFADLLDVFTRVGMMKAEESLIEEAELNRGKSEGELLQIAEQKKAEDVDAESGAEMVAEFGLMRVSTEPGAISDEELLNDDMSEESAHLRRAQTIA